MMKKVLFTFLVCGLILTTGCGKKEETPNNNDNNNTVEKEETKELSLTDSTVVELIEKIDFDDYAQLYVLSSIYKNGDFTLDSIPNDLILRMGWANIDIDTDLENGNIYIDETGSPVRKVSKERLYNSIKEIFGSNIKYTNESFINADAGFINGMPSSGMIEYSDEKYIADFNQGGGEFTDHIIQNAYKAINYPNKDIIEIYAHLYFEEMVFSQEEDYLFNVTVYNDYNYENEEFINKVHNYKIKTNDANSYYDEFKSSLNSYVYTFTKQADGNYYLSGFRKA